jgi:hypothetical protein
LAKTPLQSRFTLLKSKFFPTKFPFFKIQKKNLAGKIYFVKERGPIKFNKKSHFKAKKKISHKFLHLTHRLE